ncbi:uncharacterized protein G2W53_026421 [Senna tora]|uniref:Uncharacterized protein n=1 Tax=Senna tora TaxID=362788 RepID=A0A834TGZ3_9FABA|nr:uncharacterized protein G2W53_026421 [Senna tora]
MARSRIHYQDYNFETCKRIATRDGILSVAPLKSVTREHEEAKELVYKGLECAYLREDMISFYIAFGLSDVAWTCKK